MEMYQAPSEANPSIEARGPVEPFRAVFLGLDCVVGVYWLYAALATALRIETFSGTVGAELIAEQIGLAHMVLFPALFLWKRWRFRWALQLAVGSPSLLMALLMLVELLGRRLSG